MNANIEGFKATVLEATLYWRQHENAEGFCRTINQNRDRYLAKSMTTDEVTEVNAIADAAIKRATSEGVKIYLPE